MLLLISINIIICYDPWLGTQAVAVLMKKETGHLRGNGTSAAAAEMVHVESVSQASSEKVHLPRALLGGRGGDFQERVVLYWSTRSLFFHSVILK